MAVAINTQPYSMAVAVNAAVVMTLVMFNAVAMGVALSVTLVSWRS